MARTIGQVKFLETLEKAISKSANLGEQIIKRDKLSYDNDKKVYVNNIKKEAVAYKQSVKAVKEVSGIRKLIPGGTSALLDIAESQAKSTIDRVSGYKNMLEELTAKVKEVEDNEKDLIEAKKEAEDREFEAVKKLLKSKFILEMRYESGVGLMWTYPPMVYIADGKQYFLGKPEAGLSETNEGGFSLKLPSYVPDGHIGTYHMRHQDDGNSYCLGGYDDLLKILAAKRQLSSIIRIFKEYFLSANAKSKHNIPQHLTMDICLPKVKDDSWNEFKKANPKDKYPEPSAALHVNHCDECDSDYTGEECDNCN